MATILCVDDDASLTDLLRYALEREGFEVLVAPSGRAAVQVVEAVHLDLVILDLVLPDTDGLSLLAMLRAVSAVPVLLLTGRDGAEPFAASRAFGAVAYVAKPVAVPVLIGRITDLLGRGRSPPSCGCSGATRSRRIKPITAS